MDVLAPALEEKKGTSPPLLKTDGEARPSQDKAREREWSDTRQRRRKPPPRVSICAITSSNAAINKIKRHYHEERNFGHSDPPDRASEPRTDRTYRVHNSQA
jgi:hypothetical protein